MMEIYDAPMLEPDVDVPMHTTFGSSPKTWGEATMDDDSYETADVEVDMEGYGDGVEYEMEDESSGYEEQPVPVVDVDFVDAQAEEAPAVATEQVLEHDMSLEHAVLEESATAESLDGVAEASFVTAFEGDITVAEPSALDTAPPEEAHTAPAAEDAHEEAQPEPFDAPSEAHPEYLAERSDEVTDGPYEEAAGGSYEDPGAAPYEEATSEHGGENDAVYDAENGPYDEVQGEAYVGEAPPAESGEGYVASPDDDPEVYQEPEGSLEQEYEGDPHEIDDGMFIEPPPAVLFDISTSSDSDGPIFCLFNEPSASRAGSSSREPSTPPQYFVLLQEHPTLYYAPLSEVFSELRSDENVQRYMPDCAEGELMLDAYDLQLVISEDNVLASEVSLHDLNSLHDGANHDGPLRLRLRCSPFRFLTRYYALREQIYRMDLAEADATYDADEVEGAETQDHNGSDEQFVALAPAAETHIQEQAESQAQQDLEAGQATQEDADGEYDPVPDVVNHDEAPDEGDQGQYDDAEADDTEEQDQPTSITQQEADADTHEVPGEDAHALETEYDGPYPDHTDPPTDLQGELDADDIHAHADTDATAGLAPETTEYAEETVPHEEDEEEGDETEEAAVGALDVSAPVDEGEEAFEGEGSEETLDDDAGDTAYSFGEGEPSVEDGYPDDEGAEEGELDEDEQPPADPAADNADASNVFSSSSLPTLANGGESASSGYWDEVYEGETITPSVSEGTLKRRYDDLEEYDDIHEVDPTSEQFSATPDSKRARVE
ncbi:hypothetical protein PENSPDRAFT_657980 [Peniophora sp. CONT]|nr:hypothetical protein PENSPDRAFT_657980 [Peniophora sp. CONT]